VTTPNASIDDPYCCNDADVCVWTWSSSSLKWNRVRRQLESLTYNARVYVCESVCVRVCVVKWVSLQPTRCGVVCTVCRRISVWCRTVNAVGTGTGRWQSTSSNNERFFKFFFGHPVQLREKRETDSEVDIERGGGVVDTQVNFTRWECWGIATRTIEITVAGCGERMMWKADLWMMSVDLLVGDLLWVCVWCWLGGRNVMSGMSEYWASVLEMYFWAEAQSIIWIYS